MENNMKKRINLIDTIRGICIIIMMAHHAAFVIGYMGFFENVGAVHAYVDFFDTALYRVIWVFVVSGFISIAGVSSSFSSNNFKRGAKVLGAALIITLVSIFVVEPPIWFGVLHCIGACILIHACFSRFLSKVHISVPLALFALTYYLFYFTDIFCIQPVYFNVFSLKINLPLYILGFYDTSFASADYFSLIPWFFMYWVGVKLGKSIKEQRFPGWFYSKDVRPLSFLGRHSLLIYLLHQPVFMAVFYAVDFLIK